MRNQTAAPDLCAQGQTVTQLSKALQDVPEVPKLTHSKSI
jgi:hypothetical protein